MIPEFLKWSQLSSEHLLSEIMRSELPKIEIELYSDSKNSVKLPSSFNNTIVWGGPISIYYQARFYNAIFQKFQFVTLSH